MRRPTLPLVLLGLLAFAGCEKSSATLDTPAPDPKPPTALLAMVELPSGTDASKLADAVAQIAPEARASVATGLPMAIGKLLGEVAAPVDAIELDAPMRILVVHSKDADDSEPDILFIVRSSDELAPADGVALTRLGKDALIGPPDAVTALEAYAAHLVTEPLTELRATAFPKSLLTAYGAKLDALPGTLAAEMPESPVDMAALMQVYVDLGRALGQDAERIVATVGSEAGAAHLIVRLHARPETSLAAFIAAQKPSSFELHQQLPAQLDGAMFFETSLRASVALEPMLRLAGTVFAKDEDSKANMAMVEMMRRYADLLTGDSAMIMSMKMDGDQAIPVVEGVGLYGVTDAKPALDTTIELMKLWTGTRAIMGMDQSITIDGDEMHRGIAITKMTSTVTIEGMGSGQPQVIANQSAFTADGKLMTYAMGERSVELARRSLDTQRDGGEAGYAPPDALARALDRAKRDKDSMLAFIDLGAFMPGVPMPQLAMVMTLGFENDVATFTMGAMKK